MRKVLVGFGLAAVAALAVGACGGGGGDKAAENLVKGVTGGSVDVNLDEKGNGTINGGGENGGSISIGGTELPAELEDFPLPDGAKVISSYSGSGDSGGGSVVSVAAKGDWKKVAAGIKSGLEDSGAKVTGTSDSEAGGTGTSIVSFEGKDLGGTVMVTEDTSTEGYNLLISIMTGTAAAGTGG